MGISQTRVPVLVTSSILCLVLGVGMGLVVMTAFGYNWNDPRTRKTDAQPSSPSGGGDMMGGRAPAAGGGRGPDASAQLTALVTKL